MKIVILCSSPDHPINKVLCNWKKTMTLKGHEILIVRNKEQLQEGDILFLVSCHEILSSNERNKFKKALVLHASDLPDGRGWSPHVWQILEGANKITVSLIEASDEIDKGKIWLKEKFNLDGHELFCEINEKLFATELSLMTQAVNNFDNITPQEQVKNNGTYYRKRVPDDSELDPSKSILEQFDLMRVADHERYPAYFHHRGKKYYLKLYK